MRWILCLLMLASLGFAPAPVYKPRNDKHTDFDIEKLRGTWRSTSYRREGRNVGMATTWKFSNDSLEVRQDSGAIGFNFHIDTARSPKTLELKLFGQIHRRVICKLEDDTLTVCFNEGIATAPRAFDGEKKGQNLILFERHKDR
jgi:uncharacterized protein (TIGR03067 family)